MPAAVPRAGAADDQAPGRRRRDPRRGPAALSGALPRSPGRPDERDVAAVRRDGGRHRRRRPARAAPARAGHGRPAGRGALPQHAGRARGSGAAMADDDALSRDGARLQRLARRGVLPGLARPSHRPRRHPVDQPRRRRRRAPPLREARAQGREPRRVPERQVVPDARGRPVLGGGDRHEDAADRPRRLRPARPARLAADVRVSRRRSRGAQEARARARSWTGWRCRSSASRRR